MTKKKWHSFSILCHALNKPNSTKFVLYMYVRHYLIMSNIHYILNLLMKFSLVNFKAVDLSEIFGTVLFS